MRIQALFLFGAIGCGSLFASAQGANAGSAAKPAAQQAPKASVHTTAQDPGERKFQQNCSRCHNAPQELPTRITGTVVRHMRVRASLSAEDERDILRYLAP